jgi:hypothetical protein
MLDNGINRIYICDENNNMIWQRKKNILSMNWEVKGARRNSSLIFL